MPDWSAFAVRAGGAVQRYWGEAPCPEGIRLGETVVGEGRRDLILGTLRTAPGGRAGRPGRVHRTFPCGLYLGGGRELLHQWDSIERDLIREWAIPSRSGDWRDQRPFYRHLRNWLFGEFADAPGLVWVVPYWALTINPTIEGMVDAAAGPIVAPLRADQPLYFGLPGGVRRDLVIPARLMRNFRFQASLDWGDDDPSEVNWVYRHRYFRPGFRGTSDVYMRDNYLTGGSYDDPALREKGFERATQDYFRVVDGWRIHGAWAVLMASFRPSPSRHAVRVIYIHAVIDPFTQRTHGVGIIRMDYSFFWSISFGLAATVRRLL